MREQDEDIAAIAFAMSMSHHALELGVSARVLAKALAYIGEGLRDYAAANGGKLPSAPVTCAILVSTADDTATTRC